MLLTNWFGELGLVYALFAAADFLYQKYKHRQNMMMTKQELKDEFRQSEGDPLVKSRIRKIQMQASKRRMMQEIPTADVVITNPTHFAIALRYDMMKDKAPKVVAKGVDAVAQRLKLLPFNITFLCMKTENLQELYLKAAK